MIDAATFGVPNWVDLSSPDVTAATTFYSELFDWKMASSKTPMGEYHIASSRGFEVVGMMQQGPEMKGMPGVWTMFVYVANVDAAAVDVESAGGKVVQPPFEIPGGARVGVMTDPTGAMLAMISGGPTPAGEYYSNESGRVCWLELLTRDPDSALDFYRTVFGWEATSETSGDVEYITFKLGGEDVGGMMMMPDAVPAAAPAHWSVYFAVADCAATTGMARQLGGKVLRPPMDTGMGKFAVLEDPHGAVFDVLEYAEL